MGESKKIKKLSEFLNDLGIIFFDQIDEDYDLRDYIADSIMFINLIVSIEEYYGISFPDDHLSYEVLTSANSLEKIIQELIKIKNMST